MVDCDDDSDNGDGYNDGSYARKKTTRPIHIIPYTAFFYFNCRAFLSFRADFA